MTLTRLTLAAVALSALTVTACATMQVNSYVEQGADVTRYHTYHWGPADTPRPPAILALTTTSSFATGFRLRSTGGSVIGDSRKPLRRAPISWSTITPASRRRSMPTVSISRTSPVMTANPTWYDAGNYCGRSRGRADASACWWGGPRRVSTVPLTIRRSWNAGSMKQ